MILRGPLKFDAVQYGVKCLYAEQAGWAEGCICNFDVHDLLRPRRITVLGCRIHPEGGTRFAEYEGDGLAVLDQHSRDGWADDDLPQEAPARTGAGDSLSAFAPLREHEDVSRQGVKQDPARATPLFAAVTPGAGIAVFHGRGQVLLSLDEAEALRDALCAAYEGGTVVRGAWWVEFDAESVTLSLSGFTIAMPNALAAALLEALDAAVPVARGQHPAQTAAATAATR